MKFLTKVIVFLLFFSCSSMEDTRPVEDSVSSNAYSFLNSAERMRFEGHYKESIDYYEKAGREFLSKLLFREFTLSQLKKVMLLIKLKHFKKALSEIDFIKFCSDKYKLELADAIEGVELRYYVEKGNQKVVKELISKVLVRKNLRPLRRSYFESILLRISPGDIDKDKLKNSFNKFYESYESGALKNIESLIYIGQGLLDASDEFEHSTFTRMSRIARDLEIKTLSIYLIKYQIRFSKAEERVKLKRLLRILKSA